MRGIDKHSEYIDAQKKFKEKVLKDEECHKVSDCDSDWSIFKNAFLTVANERCPICETNLDSYDDIDHIQPKAHYPHVKCCCKNYLIMCCACNRAYKRDQFPIDENDEDKDAIVNISDKNRLLVNPREDELLNYFQLQFITLQSFRKVLYMLPKNGLNKKDKKMAEATIALYGLSDCESTKMKDRCRIRLLQDHYSSFIKFAKAKKHSNEKFMSMIDDKDLNSLISYGFIKFISRGQFDIVRE